MITDIFTKNAVVPKTKVKKVRITANTIKAHIAWIDEEMQKVQKERERYSEIQKELNVMDPDDKRYSELKKEAEMYVDADDRYSKLQEQKEKEYVILKKHKDSKFYIQPKDLMIIFGVGALSFYMISLERENPKALKLASFVLKLFPIKM